jgi:hypothetical protein
VRFWDSSAIVPLVAEERGSNDLLSDAAAREGFDVVAPG